MRHSWKRVIQVIIAFSPLVASSCNDAGEADPRQTQENAVTTDDHLFTLVTQRQRFMSYALFPRVDSLAVGTLNGSNAHRPMVRVSMNTTALGALHDGKLPPGTSFPDGSILLKEIRLESQTALYAIMYKERNNALAGNGWLWAEYQPDGTVAFSITARGNGCTSCHMREQGARHDFVRTFERQR